MAEMVLYLQIHTRRAHERLKTQWSGESGGSVLPSACGLRKVIEDKMLPSKRAISYTVLEPYKLMSSHHFVGCMISSLARPWLAPSGSRPGTGRHRGLYHLGALGAPEALLASLLERLII